MANSIDNLGDIWKNKKSNPEKCCSLIIFIALMFLSCSYSDHISDIELEKAKHQPEITTNATTTSDHISDSEFDTLFKIPKDDLTTKATKTTHHISELDFESIFAEAENQPDITTKATSTTTTSTTTTTSRPDFTNKHCGLHKKRICVKRSECSTTRRSKIIIELQKPSLSGCHYLEACCHPEDLLPPDEYEMDLNLEICGRTNVNGLFMTVKGGDLESSFAEFPWTVAILNTNQELLCSGALISDKVILTTATCLFPEQPLIVRAGEWDLRTDKEPVPHVNREVQKRIIHKSFSWSNDNYNIAILILNNEFPNLKHIVPACLNDEDADLDFDNCYVSGWHVRQAYQSPVPKREIVLKIKMDLETTSNSAGRTFNGYIQSDRPVVMSGAPLVCQTEDIRYHLVGAWSAGINATSFTDVRQYRKWIREELAKDNIEI